MCKTEIVNEYINIQTGEKLDLDRVHGLKDNAMLKVKPELWIEWNFEKNNELGFDIWKMTKGSNRKIWWICPNCKIAYDMFIINRVRKGFNCPYCKGRRVNHTNSLSSLRLDIASEWHPAKNGNLTPHDVSCGSKKKVWWLCSRGHYWNATVNNRTKGNGCPYCSGHKTWVGLNDMWTTNPELAILLANPEDGYKYSQFSNKKVDWKCSDCGEVIPQKCINNISKFGLSCPICSDGISFPEKFIYHILKEKNINFTFQKNFNWTKDKRYDFYIESLNCIIEVHGEQHTTGKYKNIYMRDEKVNDRYKYELAIKNGVEHYLVIDAFVSTGKYIYNSITNLDSPIKDILLPFSFKEIEEKAREKLTKEVWKYWNMGLSVKEISKEIKLNRATVRKYLKIGAYLDKCNYNIEKSKARRKVISKNTIIQLDKDFNYIKEWESVSLIMEDFKNQGIKVNSSYIYRVCVGKRNIALGYRWMYKKDYEKWIEG